MFGGTGPVLALIAAAVLTACGDERHAAYGEKQGTSAEFVGQAPDGELTPVFGTERQVREHIEANPDAFPPGTVIFRR